MRHLILTSILLLSGCSSDDHITSDYVIYDLGGSNQTLIGNAGMTSVPDVTAYATAGRFIIVETKQCQYGFIDSASGKVAKVPKSSAAYQMLIEHVARHGHRILVNQRQCIDLPQINL